MRDAHPFVGSSYDETVDQCQKVLAVVSQAIESETALCDTGKDEVMGHYLIISAVRDALIFERDNCNEETLLKEVSA